MTDSQTHSTTKSTYWSVTAFGSEIQELQQSSCWPSFVTKIYGGLETCPTSGRIHYQAMVQCRSQQRFSAIKKWLPTSHIEKANKPDALKRYVMKAATAAGEKVVLKSSSSSFQKNHQILTHMAEVLFDEYDLETPGQAILWLDRMDEDGKIMHPLRSFRPIFRQLVRRNSEYVNYTSAQLQRNWVDYCEVFINNVYSARLHSITQSAQGTPDAFQASEGSEASQASLPPKCLLYEDLDSTDNESQ